MARLLTADTVLPGVDTLDLADLYDEHADFVWRSLHRLGIRAADLPDLVQEVFVVVHRRFSELDRTRPVRGWLFGISAGLARNYHRRSFRKAERLSGEVDRTRDERDPERALDEKSARERGLRLLSALDPEKRAVFVMFEIEGLSGREIAAQLGVPLGTVHSRLHAARRELTAALSAEHEQREHER